MSTWGSRGQCCPLPTVSPHPALHGGPSRVGDMGPTGVESAMVALCSGQLCGQSRALTGAQDEAWGACVAGRGAQDRQARGMQPWTEPHRVSWSKAGVGGTEADKDRAQCKPWKETPSVRGVPKSGSHLSVTHSVPTQVSQAGVWCGDGDGVLASRWVPMALPIPVCPVRGKLRHRWGGHCLGSQGLAHRLRPDSTALSYSSSFLFFNFSEIHRTYD